MVRKATTLPVEIKLSELGDGIESGDVLEIFVDIGDVISVGQNIVEIDTKTLVFLYQQALRESHKDHLQ